MNPSFEVRGTGHPNARLNVNGLNCIINTPVAPKSLHDKTAEAIQDLPGYAARRPFLVDEYPACPEDWLRSSGTRNGYFVPVEEGRAMWLDFNGNNKNPFHLAIVISIQGVNAITGQPCKDSHLEQYREKCPKHQVEFGPDRLCKECGYHWPKQNYIASTGTPYGCFWLDGFRAADNVIREFVFTAEAMKRGVAQAVLGEDRVYAFGISMFLSKHPRQQHYDTTDKPCGDPHCYCGRGGGGALIEKFHCVSSSSGSSGSGRSIIGGSGPQFFSPIHSGSGWRNCVSDGFDDTKAASKPKDKDKSKGGGHLGMISDAQIAANMVEPVRSATEYNATVTPDQSLDSPDLVLGRIPDNIVTHHAFDINWQPTPPPVKLEVAAGARIDQVIYPDPYGLDFWRDQPEGILLVNYCTEIEAARILAGGRTELVTQPEGFLQAVPVGN